MSPKSGDATQNEKLIPARFWWLKRLACDAVIMLVVLLAVRLWWGWEAQRRFDAAIAKCRAAGEPVLVDDFLIAPLPDDENAAFFLNGNW
ncbi:MAG: hypothetical protein KBH81_00180 [Phycisphaerae bacterium]|nr:hypothetical protein [Phycisphaerae bacterium]HOO16374.1 hypothetical protein [Phycisphaerae bacterium]HPC22058.1 hypothetical protein [Phycisphaerae bacterium]HRS27106.1 hypothetical protein [Phycisphaerae bacterium]HRT40715.1 hypothetical protein [Phycisphaerae bacterium]